MPVITRNNRQIVQLAAADGATAEVHLHGAHVTSWIPAGGVDVFYLSPIAVYKDGTALRGGIPIIWPQFSDMGPLPAHGFARGRYWDLVEEGAGFAVLLLTVDENDSILAGCSLSVSYRIEFCSREFKATLTVRNNGAAPITFTDALHSYFAVSNIANVTIEGLDNCSYADNLQKREICAPAEIRVIDREVDRIYVDVRSPVVVTDSGLKRSIVITGGEAHPNVVLWNAWIEKAKKLADMPDEDYQKYVCVEHGSVLTKVNLDGGKTWDGFQKIVLENF